MKKIFRRYNYFNNLNTGRIIIISWILFTLTFILINHLDITSPQSSLVMRLGTNEMQTYQEKIKELSAIDNNPEEKVEDIIVQTVDNNRVTYYIKNEILYHNPNLSPYEASYRALYIYNTAKEIEVDPYLITAIGTVESNHRQNSLSSKGAVGILQLTSTVERIYNVDAEIFEENIRGGAQFIRDLTDQYDDLELALAHYNGGSRPYYKVENYEETSSYVEKVQNIFNTMKQRYENNVETGFTSEEFNNDEESNSDND
ncbi:MAG: lytic transglycosylase domain-containing protein [Bacillota bacterium]